MNKSALIEAEPKSAICQNEIEEVPEVTHSEKYLKQRRFIEILFIIICCPLVIILIVLVSMIILLSEKGSIFYVQERIGKDRKRFNIYKFRTMKSHKADTEYRDSKKYVTGIGRILRRFRFDELPQLWNILKGDMSLIGPRPETPELFEFFEENISKYKYRTLILPGLTGYAQVNLPHSVTLQGNRQKTEYDLYYLMNLSPKLDLYIIFKTFYTVFSGKGE